jgi:hypothetical protein
VYISKQKLILGRLCTFANCLKTHAIINLHIATHGKTKKFSQYMRELKISFVLLSEMVKGGIT